MQNPLLVLTLIPLLPFVGFLLLMFWGRFAPRLFTVLSTILLTISGVLAINLYLARDVLVSGETCLLAEKSWFSLGSFAFKIGFRLDHHAIDFAPLLAIILLVVYVFSIVNLKHRESAEPQESLELQRDSSRYFAVLSLGSALVFTLLFSSNLLVFLIAASGLSFCSYFLISSHYDSEKSVATGTQAFIISLLGDLCILAGTFMILVFGYQTLVGLDSETLEKLVEQGVDINNSASLLSFSSLEILFKNPEFVLGFSPYLPAIALILFFVALTKFAQFPFHMPIVKVFTSSSPTSGITHTVFTAIVGLFFFLRIKGVLYSGVMHDLPSVSRYLCGGYLLSNIALSIGVITALISVVFATIQSDIRKIVAYVILALLALAFSEVTTLSWGTALGASHYFAQLIALLLLVMVVVYHSYGTYDLKQIRRVAKDTKDKWIIRTAMILAINVSAFSLLYFLPQFPMEFYKISIPQFTSTILLAVLSVIFAFLGFPVFRMLFTVFGNTRNRAELTNAPRLARVSVSLLHVLLVLPLAYTPLTLLVLQLSLSDGSLISILDTTTLVLPFVIVFFAWLVYSKKAISAEKLDRIFPPLSRFLENEAYLGKAYNYTVSPALQGFSKLVRKFDKVVIDELFTTSTSRLSLWIGHSFRQLHTGMVQMYLFTIAIALLVLIFIFNLIRFS